MKVIASKPLGSEDGLEFISSGKDQDKYSLVTEEALSRRQIHIMGEITDVTFEQIKHLYDQLVEDDYNKPIHIILNGPGGDAGAMLGIMNLIILSKTPCYTYLMNEAFSAAAWIYLCGHKRFAPKTDLIGFMLHPINWDSSDSLGNHSALNTYIEKLSTQLIKFTAKQTKIPLKKLKKLSTVETQFFVGDELFKYGIATDELTTSCFWFDPEAEKKQPQVIESPLPILLTE